MQLNPNIDIANYGDSGLGALCDTKNARLQTMLLCCVYGTKDANPDLTMTPTEYFSRVVLKDTFHFAMDEADKETWRLIDDEEQPCTVVVNHRGDGKTVRFAAKALREIVFRLCPFLLYIQSTHEDAATEMDNVKSEMMGNDFITEVFHNMGAREFRGVNKDFSKRAWFACNPNHPSVPKEQRGEPFAFVLPRGFGGQRFRGRNIYIAGKRVRPRLIIGDDLDDDKEVLSAENRAYNKSLWDNSVMKTPAQHQYPDAVTNRWKKPKGAGWNWRAPHRVFVAGTLLHHDCMVANFSARSNWKVAKFPLGKAEESDDGKVTYTSLRKLRVSDAQLANMASNEKANGNLDGFYREMLCMPVSKEFSCWKQSMFQQYTLEREQELQNDPSIVRCVIVDPSKVAAQHADLTGILVCAIDPKLGAIYMRRAISEHLTTAQIPVRALEVAVETNSRIVAVERIGAEGYVDTNFINATVERGMNVQLIWLGVGHTPHGDYGTGNDAIKRWRAQQILPYYQEMNVWHHPDHVTGSSMERMMLDYPRPADWCMTDCAGYIPAVMHEIGVTFSTQRAKHENISRFKDYFDERKMNTAIQSNSWACV